MNEPATATAPAEAAQPVAVIDIGTNAIRMAIAQIGADGQIRILETLQQAVNMAKDTFIKGRIEKATIEETVRVLKSFRAKLNEYKIPFGPSIRAVATSAVREALNRDAFVDRVYIATGLQVEVIDETEATRITYLSIQPFLKAEPAFANTETLIVEVGGGSTELLLVNKLEVVWAMNYRVGSMRLRETLESYRASAPRLRKIMEENIARMVDQIGVNVALEDSPNLIAIGGDARLAAAQLVEGWTPDRLARIPLPALARLVDDILGLSVDELVKKYRVTFQEAETAGPALLAILQIARAANLRQVMVTGATMRDGLLIEMSRRGAVTEEFNSQIIRSALNLGRKFEFDEAHAIHVARLCDALFKALQPEHRLEQRFAIVLHVAALLHEIGLFINSGSHHKHSMYLILNSELFGLSKRDVLLAALVARYHRRATPQSNHEGYAALDREHRIIVSKLAALLRVADALDRSHSQRIADIQCAFDNEQFVITVPPVDDLTLEQMALTQKGAMFEDVYGLVLALRKSRTEAG
jgi:exopolyphosphatase/guanosine-5'-triphosphate,3'-diphosphate pyrophosphatase